MMVRQDLEPVLDLAVEPSVSVLTGAQLTEVESQ